MPGDGKLVALHMNTLCCLVTVSLHRCHRLKCCPFVVPLTLAKEAFKTLLTHSPEYLMLPHINIHLVVECSFSSNAETKLLYNRVIITQYYEPLKDKVLVFFNFVSSTA